MKRTPLKVKSSTLKPGKAGGLKISGKGLKHTSSLKKTSSLKAGDNQLKTETPMKKQNERSKEKWLAVREKALQRDNYKCVVCGKPATQVHHIHLRSKRKDLVYEINNLVSLCDKHHFHSSNDRYEEQTLLIARAKKLTVEELLKQAEVKEEDND